MVQNGVLVQRDEPTDWVSSLVVVQKSNGQLRICLDSRDLNRVIKRGNISLFPRLLTLLQSCMESASSVSSTWRMDFGTYALIQTVYFQLDLWSTFLHASAIWNCECFQKKANEIFGDIPDVFVIFDDLHCCWNRWTTRAHITQGVQTSAREKCSFQPQQDPTSYATMQIHWTFVDIRRNSCWSKQGQGHLRHRLAYRRPRLHRLLSVTIRSASRRSHCSFAPVDAQLMPWTWTTQHEQSFNDIKQAVTSAPVLQYFDPSKQVTIQTDAGSTGLGRACSKIANQSNLTHEH